MMNQLYTSEMVGNHQASISNWLLRVPGCYHILVVLHSDLLAIDTGSARKLRMLYFLIPNGVRQ